MENLFIAFDGGSFKISYYVNKPFEKTNLSCIRK